MPFSLEKQLRLFGPQLFEELCHKLIAGPDGTAFHVEGKGGDEGIDIFSGPRGVPKSERNGEKLHVWQVKFFPDGLKECQRGQIRESFKRVMDKHEPDTWTLCVPVNLEQDELDWWDQYKAKHTEVEMNLLDGGNVVKLAMEPQHASILSQYFIGPSHEGATDKILKRLNDFEGVPEKLEQAERATKPKTDFYDGAVADWNDILKRRDAYREKTAELWQFVHDRVTNPGGSVPFIVLTGESGEGKTTILKRFAAGLVDAGYKAVYWHKPFSEKLSPEQFADLGDGTVAFIFIDKVSNFDLHTLNGFLDGLRCIPIRPVVIAAAITSLWDDLTRDPENYADFRRIRLERMTRRDILALLDKLTEDPEHADEYLGKLAGHTREEQVQVFEGKSKSQLLVALLEAKYGVKFKKFVLDELAELHERHKGCLREACDYVSALHRLDLPMPKSMLERLLPGCGDLEREVFRKTQGLIQLLAEGGNIVTRHSLIAQVIYEDSRGQEEWYKRIIAAALGSDEESLMGRMIHTIRVSGERELAMRLLLWASVRFPCSPTFLFMHGQHSRATDDIAGARLFFRKAIDLDPSHALTLRAWAMLERDERNTGYKDDPRPYTARWLFGKAVDADPSAASVWLTWAAMERQRRNVGSLDEPEPHTARWLFRKATQAVPNDIHIRLAWAMMEKEQGNIGEETDPAACTARWLLRKAVELDPTSAHCWQVWAALERDEGNVGDRENPAEYTARWLLRKALEVDPAHIPSMHTWGILEKEQGNIGEREDPLDCTARWLFRKATDTTPEAPHTWHASAVMEMDAGNVGDEDCPQEHTARWLFRKAADADPKSAHVWQAWAAMEHKQGNTGPLDGSKEYSARWLFRKAADADPKSAHVWQAWAIMEKEQDNIGPLDGSKEYSARWLFRKAAEVYPKDAPAWQAWAIMEKEQGNIGPLDGSKEYSARWLFRRAAEVDPRAAPTWQAWAVMEKEQDNIGTLDGSDPYSARWLFREGVKADPNMPHTWQAWAVMEKEQKNVGAPDGSDPYSARWLFREGVKADPKNAHTWQAWGVMETAEKNVGAPDGSEPYSARWLFRRAEEADPDHDSIWRPWAALEMRQGNIGQMCDPKRYTARWLCRRAIEVTPRAAWAWQAWAMLEAEQGNIGNCKRPAPHTARWLYRKCAETADLDSSTCYTWAVLEAEQGNIGQKADFEEFTARWLFRTSVELSPNYAGAWHKWALMEMREGNLGDPDAPEEYTARWLLPKAMSLDTKNGRLLTQWATMEKAQENWAEAERLYKKVLEITSSPVKRRGVHRTMGMMMLWLGRAEEAAEHLESVTDGNTTDYMARIYLASAHATLHSWDDSDAQFQIAMGMSPGNYGVQDLYHVMLGYRDRIEALETGVSDE